MAEETSRLAEPSERGELHIADRVVEQIAAIAAREVAATTGRSGAWTGLVHRDLPRASARVAGGRTRIHVDVAAAWPTPLARVAAEVRDRVAQQVGDLTGFAVVAVDVSVTDVVHPETTRRRVR